jgi:hypothetical protein
MRSRKLKYNTEEERLEAIRASKRKYQKKYKERNPEYIKVWRSNNVEKIREFGKDYEVKRRKSDPVYKLGRDIRSLINGSFRRKSCIKPEKTESIIGCSILELQKYLLSKCPEGTTLSDFNRYGYHIDHIVPLSTAKTEEEVLKLCHYTNLQPLWCTDNLKKSSKV